jgi:Xeroderma pigmentosum group B helicase damage recognition domain/Type III restriction enzyme, res subunit
LIEGLKHTARSEDLWKRDYIARFNQIMKLTFDKGTIQIKGDIRVPNSTWDERSKTFRAMALYYRDIIDFLKISGFDFEDDVLDLLPCPELQSSVVLRDYQNQALDAWTANGNRGIIVLATGAGKTVIGIKAISLLNTPTLVVAPTLDLVDQWRNQAEERVQDRGRGVRWR